jgi:FkbM family methyltransferase
VRDWDYIEVDGLKYAYMPTMCAELRRRDDSMFYGIRPDDVVLDIGANIGDTSIPISTRCKRVYAYEPVFSDTLKQNVAINEIKNITVYRAGLGPLERDYEYYEYAGMKARARQMTFFEMLTYCGGSLTAPGHVDFLRCDCEGGEWEIDPSFCAGIREMRFEFHFRRDRVEEEDNKFTKWVLWWNENGYKVTMDKLPVWTDFKAQYEVTASKV